MNMVDVQSLDYRYGRTIALDALSFSVPEGAVYALLGPNGSGKTTLLQILMGLRRAKHGSALVMRVESSRFSTRDKQHIGYVAEGQQLPGWMRLEQLEAYLAPLYPTWDFTLATALRKRLDLDLKKTIKAMSRGESMKASLLCALAYRPKLVLMDEPFTGMDVVVRDELVRGLLDTAGSEGWTVLLCSHDIREIEMLADWVGFLSSGTLQLSEPMESLRNRFRHVEVAIGEVSSAASATYPPTWMSVERAGARVSFVAPRVGEAVDERVVRRMHSRDAGSQSIAIGTSGFYRASFKTVLEPLSNGISRNPDAMPDAQWMQDAEMTMVHSAGLRHSGAIA